MAREHHGSSIVSATGPSRSPRRPQPARAASGSRGRSRRRAALLFGGAAVAVAVVVTGVIVAIGDDSAPTESPLPADTVITSVPATSSEASTPSESSPSPAPAESAQGDCSMPAGGQDSGENAIRAFEHRLYVERSGAAAFELISRPRRSSPLSRTSISVSPRPRSGRNTASTSIRFCPGCSPSPSVSSNPTGHPARSTRPSASPPPWSTGVISSNRSPK